MMYNHILKLNLRVGYNFLVSICPLQWAELSFHKSVVTDNFLPTEEQYICTDDYSPSNSDEMALEKGTVVKVVEKNLDGWWWIQ